MRFGVKLVLATEYTEGIEFRAVDIFIDANFSVNTGFVILVKVKIWFPLPREGHL